MLQASLKTRGEDRKRLKRYEPSYPIPGLFPASPCPHPANPRPGYYCGSRECVGHGDQTAIDRSEAPRPINPEDRAAAKIREYQQALEGLDPAKHPRLIAGLHAEIQRQREIIDEYSGQPTVYKPNPRLKGGMGK